MANCHENENDNGKIDLDVDIETIYEVQRASVDHVFMYKATLKQHLRLNSRKN